jgi:hypothetical protein
MDGTHQLLTLLKESGTLPSQVMTNTNIDLAALSAKHDAGEVRP